MEYKKGYKIKPYAIRKDGIVEFTDGTNIDLIGNEKTCKAYGYEYDSVAGTCRAFNVSTEVWKIGKPRNESYSKNSLEVGQNHTLSQNQNTFVSGAKHEIDNRLENVSVIGGKLGKATLSGEVVIGGGDGDGASAGQIQTSIIHLSGESSGDDIDLYTQGSDRGEIILPANSINTYELFITSVCIGGSAGTAGDYKAFREVGSVRCDNAGTLIKRSHVSSDIDGDGDTGTITIDTSVAFTFTISFAGATNVNSQVSAVVKLYINQTKVVEF